MVERMVRCARDDLAEETVEVGRLQFEIRMAERIDDEIADIPTRDTEDVETRELVDQGERKQQTKVEDQFLGERKRDRGHPRVNVALVVLDVNPVQWAPVEGSMRGIVPDFGPDRRERRRRYEQREAAVHKESRVDEQRQQNGVDRRVYRIQRLALNLLPVDRQIVDLSFAEL